MSTTSKKNGGIDAATQRTTRIRSAYAALRKELDDMTKEEQQRYIQEKVSAENLQVHVSQVNAIIGAGSLLDAVLDRILRLIPE